MKDKIDLVIHKEFYDDLDEIIETLDFISKKEMLLNKLGFCFVKIEPDIAKYYKKSELLSKLIDAVNKLK